MTTNNWQVCEVIERRLKAYSEDQLNLASESTRRNIARDLTIAITSKFYTVPFTSHRESDDEY